MNGGFCAKKYGVFVNLNVVVQWVDNIKGITGDVSEIHLQYAACSFLRTSTAFTIVCFVSYYLLLLGLSGHECDSTVQKASKGSVKLVHLHRIAFHSFVCVHHILKQFNMLQKKSLIKAIHCSY